MERRDGGGSVSSSTLRSSAECLLDLLDYGKEIRSSRPPSDNEWVCPQAYAQALRADWAG